MELRVHGMGNHEPLSALGSGQRKKTKLESENGDYRAGVEMYEEPEGVWHTVRFLNWTRSSRSRIPFLWYVALPYTFVNVAGFMQPDQKWMKRTLAVIVSIWGAFAIIGTFLWATLAAETVIQYFADNGQATIGAWAAGVIAALMLMAMLYRTVLRGELPLLKDGNGLYLRSAPPGEGPGTRDWTLYRNVTIHFFVLAAVAAVVIISRPASNFGEGCFVTASVDECVIYRHDWVTLFALATFALSAVMVVLFAVLNWLSGDYTWCKTDADPLLGAAMLLSAGLLVLNLGWAAAVRAVTWLFEYIAVHIPGVDPLDNVTKAGGLLRPRNDFVYGPDIVVGIFAPHITLAVAVAAALVAYRMVQRIRRKNVSSTPEWSAFRKWRSKELHELICDESRLRLTGTMLVLVVLVLTVPAVLEIIFCYPAWEREVERTDAGEVEASVDLFAAISSVSVDVLLALIIVALVMPSVRRRFAVIGDIAGFWDIKWHGLAALPYRQDVVDVLEAEIAAATKPFVLVGHSQGSVLAFTAVKEANTAEPKIHLVTCGSPLLSLYSRFFPTHFGNDERETVENKAISWANFWRDSDPIGCPLFSSRRNDYLHPPNTYDFPNPAAAPDLAVPVASKVAEATPNLPAADIDPALGLGHSDYWLVPAQRTYVAVAHGSPELDPSWTEDWAAFLAEVRTDFGQNGLGPTPPQ
ncbi:hypothetical protein ACW9HH_14945 [Nocardia gipuzkoensis]